ncbi:type II toxin-antitoxin system prevent-host-death family antitoxin [Vibrio sp. 99K-1]|jgi:antitoxin StbD|nr:type II toxin-antitoxin system prevent-host-death family antitoxin [Vibrio sp. 99K-1]NOI88243.1 type II toxin-antitoxin system prevent-host-death family antitoxin [Vibrio sp. 99K-1]
MDIIRPILADNATSITELKKNPMAVIEQADGFPVAVLNRNQPAFYCVPADAYELLMDKLEDIELAQLVEDRREQEEIEVNINDL